MSLTESEKTAGRWFRDVEQQRLLESFDDAPPTYQVPNFLAHYRHNCEKRRGVSTAMELKEIYIFSPEVHVSGKEVVESGGEETIPAGRFGFIYKEGRCSGCRQTARSRAGRLVDAYDRPPVHGRVARTVEG